jgi:hypothetical protein
MKNLQVGQLDLRKIWENVPIEQGILKIKNKWINWYLTSIT